MRTFIRFTVVTAFLAMITAAFVITPVAIQLSQAADEVLILDTASETIITGTVTDLDSDSFELLSNDKKIFVDLDDIDMEGGVDKLLSNGMKVSVEGKFDEDELKAKRIVKIEDGTAFDAARAAAKAETVEQVP